jgi:hypothetical protein
MSTPVGGLPLAGVAGHGVAVVEVRMLHGVKLHLTASVHLDGHTAFGDALHRSKLAVRQLHLRHGRGELHSVSGRERPLLLHGRQRRPADGVDRSSSRCRLQFDGEPVVRRIDLCHPRILAFGMPVS